MGEGLKRAFAATAATRRQERWGFAADDLPVNAEVYRDGRKNVRRAHGKLTRDTPIYRMGETVNEGQPIEPMRVAGGMIGGQSFVALLVRAKG
jgi:hypothetical protein